MALLGHVLLVLANDPVLVRAGTAQFSTPCPAAMLSPRITTVRGAVGEDAGLCPSAAFAAAHASKQTIPASRLRHH